MAKKIYSILIALIAIILCMFVRLFLINSFSKSFMKEDKKYDYHVQVLVKESDSDFFENFKDGAVSAGENFNVYVEFVDVYKNDIQSLTSAFEKAVYSDVDGISLQPEDETETEKLIEKAKKRDIEVVTYESGNYEIRNATMVGSNSYEIGKMISDMALTATNGRKKILVFVDTTENSYNSSIAQGIIETIKEPNEIEFCNLGGSILDITGQITNALDTYENNDINYIICTNAEYTPIVGEVIIDKSKVGDITIIGYGNLKETKELISDKVIQKTLCPNGYEVGYETVCQLVNSLNGKTASSVSTSLYELTDKNVNDSTLNIERQNMGSTK